MSRLITEADVLAGRAIDPIVVDAGTNITPAAVDRAARMGIRVVWARAGAACGVPPERGSAPLAVAELPDGQYLVHVARGQARIFRLTDGGPVPFGA